MHTLVQSHNNNNASITHHKHFHAHTQPVQYAHGTCNAPGMLHSISIKSATSNREVPRIECCVLKLLYFRVHKNFHLRSFHLQVTYVTNNPGAPAVFYQCADVRIMKM